ncbi:MAG: hypothetical protein ACD_59C00033G0011 [uncultured bacterium]|nr:MAG: hypothetical protein ACD_59C00033G0011 [uncultured bacterium]
MKIIMVEDQLIVNGQYNIGYICSTLQCLKGNSNKTAFRFISKDFQKKDYSFECLDINSNKIANVLKHLGVMKEDIVFTYLTKAPEQFFVFLGALKRQAIIGTLFSNFGDDALYDRLSDSRAKVVFTRTGLLKKILRVIGKLDRLKYIILTDSEDDVSDKILSLSKLMNSADEKYEVEITPPETPSVLHYTSGSTGKPKGVLHVHKSVLLQNRTSREILFLNERETYWCTADQGWVTGTSYGIIGPWSLGVTQIHFEGAFNQEAYFKILSDEKVTVWYTAPTLLRMLMNVDDDSYRKFDLSKLKYIFSVGEPLNPEIVNWSKRVLNKDVYDTWFQTETGSILIANRPGVAIKPGSMGKPVAGIEPRILSKIDHSVEKCGVVGYLCVKPGWDSMFINYINNKETYENKFKNGYYFTGDESKTDEDGYYWFAGRSDDIINTAGHLISPFEIESTLLELPEIAESAAIAVPDPVLFEAVVVYIRLKKFIDDLDEFKLKVRIYLSNKLSTIATPKEIIITETIPKNKSGKIMRRVLKALYLGHDAGDISTMEEL